MKPYAAEAELVLEVIKDIKENIDDIAFAANGGFVANASEERRSHMIAVARSAAIKLQSRLDDCMRVLERIARSGNEI